MANVDRPNGFRPVKTFSGAPWSSMVRSITPKDGVDIFIGDLITLESGTADQTVTTDTTILGAVVGVGKKVGSQNNQSGMFNPANLEERWYDDSDHTNTDCLIYYVPCDDVLFEAQTATALTLAVGDTCDVVGTVGDPISGTSVQEIAANINGELTVVEIPEYEDNDNTAVWGRYLVMVTRAAQAFHA